MKNLEPKAVWGIFEEITKVPRPSKNEGKIREWLIKFAQQHSLDYKADATGNVVIKRAGHQPTVVLQSHMDMVCEKNSDTQFDFAKDPIETYVDGEWVRARGTTLGADDGIGMAAALALLIDREHELPALEALFTVDEETGLTGAFGLEEGMISGKYLINLDSEDEGEIFIGCAGGVDTLATFPAVHTAAQPDDIFFRVDVKGLKGGHSGDDINKGLANANKLIVRFLWHALRELDVRVAEINGGNLRNAIPREAYTVFALPKVHTKNLFEYYERYTADVTGEFGQTEPSIEITIAEVEPQTVFDARRLVTALQGLPNGVLAMSAAIEGLVETSTNLASVKPIAGGVEVVTSQRSSVESAKHDAAAAIESVLELGGGTVTHSDGYPGWAPDTSSKLLKVSEEQYVKLFGAKPAVKAIHAGLECGLFLEKYPRLEMISVGPTLRGVHSPDERLEIATVEKFWKHLLAILQNL